MTNKNLRIQLLVVDDDPNMIKLIKFYLIKDDFEITPVTSGIEALKILQERPFDVILIDVLMPEMDGHTLLNKILKDLGLKTPVIVITAHGATDSLMTMIQDGAYDILQKPFTTNRLKLTLRNALKLKNLNEKCKNLERVTKKDSSAQ